MYLVVRVALKRPFETVPAQPCRRRAVLASRATAGEDFEAVLSENRRDHCSARDVRRYRDSLRSAGRVEQRVRLSHEVRRGERCRQLRVRCPVPIGQGKIRVAGELTAETLEGDQGSAVPGKEKPIAVWAEVIVDL